MDKERLKCKRNPGSILYADDKNHWIIDQLSDDIVKIYRSYIDRYLKSTYGISMKEYYNIVVYDDIHYSPICELDGCEKECQFINLKNGYRAHCSNSHHVSHRNIKDWKNDNYRNLMSKVLKRNNELIKTVIEFEYSAFVKDNPDFYPCYFYIGISDDLTKLKFGITKKGILDRKYRNKLHSVHKIVVSTAKVVADIERLMKYDLNSRIEWIDISRSKDVFRSLRKVLLTIGNNATSTTIP